VAEWSLWSAVWPDIVLEDQDFDVFGWIGSCDQRQPAQCMASSR
jgi:hypothetical protein